MVDTVILKILYITYCYIPMMHLCKPLTDGVGSTDMGGRYCGTVVQLIGWVYIATNHLTFFQMSGRGTSFAIHWALNKCIVLAIQPVAISMVN